MSNRTILESVYDPRTVEGSVYDAWEHSGAFRSRTDPPTPRERTFCIVIPPPNVTGALHLGHALNNTLQDILVRYHRMRGFNTLWQPGTDHAGIATQAVVERRIREQEGKSRHDLGREELVRRIWQWKDEYERRIVSQLKLLGCSCDWERNRFTLDEGLARAVRQQFFNLFRDGLIFRGKRLVNWDTELQTAVADDEIYYEAVKGKFWYFRYPVIDPRPGEPEHVVIATTRPETMLGDTAVAVCPNPREVLDKRERELQAMLEGGSGSGGVSSKDRADVESRLDQIRARRESHLPLLEKLAAMARDGRQILLPLVERRIPLIADEWADPLLGTGCVKITPAHDPNDYQVAVRREPNLPMISVLTPDGKAAPIIEPDVSAAPVLPGSAENAHSAEYAGLTFATEARAKVVADLEARGLLESVEDRDIELGHSDRSKMPIEPYLSDQWFVRTGDGPEPVELGDESKAPGLAQAAMDAVHDGRVRVFPDRYAKSYLDWLGEKRDWCISRQLWWGHRIPVWRFSPSLALHVDGYSLNSALPSDESIALARDKWSTLLRACGVASRVFVRTSLRITQEGSFEYELCFDNELADSLLHDVAKYLELRGELKSDRAGSLQNPFGNLCEQLETRYLAGGLGAIEDVSRDIMHARVEEDVLDTWFSSALWPFSTLGWPEETAHLKQYYPTSVLITSRDIITNWVARMVMFGLYSIGKVPFDHVYIHPKILDGRGETMSKSKGNGVDPVDIIHTHGADALRYTMADMTTETQDIRMPVEYVCPHCAALIDQSLAIKQEEQSRKSRGQKLDRKLQPADVKRVKCTSKECAREFATQWADAVLKGELSVARETSDKFDLGRNFCNKLWNAARYALMNLEGTQCHKLDIRDLLPEDRWILARLSRTVRRYHELIGAYQYSASIKELRDFFWDALCDWYIELTKARLSSEPQAPVLDAMTSALRMGAGQGSAGPNSPEATVRTSSARPDSAAIARQVLAFCLDQSLRLFHPTIPFITERLWQHLNEVVPQRGLPGLADAPPSDQLVLAAFPTSGGYPSLDDAGVLDAFEHLQNATRGVRDLRLSCNVPPKERVEVTVAPPAAGAEDFRANAHIVRHMAGIAMLHIDPAAKRPPNAGSVSVHGMHIYVHGISDDAADRARTTKTLADVEKQIAGKESKLCNVSFVSNAKPEVVQAERERLDQLLVQREGLRAHLAELSG